MAGRAVLFMRAMLNFTVPMKRIFTFLLTALLCSCITRVHAQEIHKKRGKCRLYYPNGAIHSTGKVKNYHRNGTWKYYDEEGHLIKLVNFVMDTVHGPYTGFYSNGQVSTKGEYNKNNKLGKWTSYDEQGHLISEENFRHGIQHGVQKYWYPGGRLRDSMVTEQGKYVFVESWYRGGGIKRIETYSNGLAEGRWLTYPESYTDTFPETSDQYHLGKKHGWHYLWRGAALLEAYHYVDGKADGTFTRYQLDGTPLMVQSYSKGFLHGVSVFYKDGKKLKEEYYSWNELDSVQTEYDRDERVSKRTWYDTGVPDSSYTYFRNGKVAIRRVNGGAKGFSNYTEWDSTGTLLMKGMMLGEKREGEWTTFYPNGKIRSTMNYSDGSLLGLYTKYYPNGKKMIQYTFLSVGTNTPPDVWNEKGKLLKPGTKQYDEIVEGNRPGEIFSDPSEFNRNIIRYLIDDNGNRIGDGEPDFIGKMEVDDALALDELNASDTDQVYSWCEVMPEFPGGLDSMRRFIQKNLRYPNDGRDFEGTVYIKYIVEKNGTIIYVTVARGLRNAPQFDSEALWLVSKFPPHEPGKMNGVPVRCEMIIPIRFALH